MTRLSSNGFVRIVFSSERVLVALAELLSHLKGCLLHEDDSANLRFGLVGVLPIGLGVNEF